MLNFGSQADLTSLEILNQLLKALKMDRYLIC